MWEKILTVFPAHAGMNRTIVFGFRIASSVPRTRGDEPGLLAGNVV